ncbi:MAG: decaprenyl-phosphate phosphoribosyltransferase [Prevotella sp.]|nr:decaprenyl-phosphate phosphoribosyltransferase [Prevotella sp.]
MNRPIITLMRPHQWLKNVFVFTPLFFDRRATDWSYVWPCVVAFMAFCLAASGIYCFNDIRDAEADRQHPVKRMRPVASGAIGKRTAYTAMGTLWVLAFTLAVLGSFHDGSFQTGLAGTLLSYVVMNMAYCLKLKQIAIVDVFIVAAGFVLRILTGGLATGIEVSHWMVLTTFLLALFLVMAKRRDDVVVYETSGVRARKSVAHYNRDFLNQSIGMLGSVTIMCYMLYTVSADVAERMGSRYLYATSVFVLAGILRYMQLTLVDQKSGSPTMVLLHDRFVRVCIVGWILAFVVILYT